MVLQNKRTIDDKANGVALDSKTSLIEPVNGAANDKDEKLNYDETVDMECDINEMSFHMEKNVTVDDCDVAVRSDGKPNESSSKISKQNSASQEVCYRC